MRERLIELRVRRASLVARAEAERSVLEGWLGRTDRWSRWAGAGASLLGELKRSPLVIAGAAALLFALRPKRVLRWALRAWSLWQVVRRARAAWRRLAPAASTR
jgi:hypothetical protein